MIDFSKSDEQLINTFGETVSVGDVSVTAIFDELPSEFGRSEDAEYKITLMESSAPEIKRDDIVTVRSNPYYVRSVQSSNGVLEVILNI